MTGRRLVMWDIDLTLIHGAGIGSIAFGHAFRALTGRSAEWLPSFAGRTDLSLTAEVFARHELSAPDLPTFFSRFAQELADLSQALREQGRVLPGAREVLAALATDPAVVQTTVTGNITANAHLKLTAFDLAGPLDLTVGGYGEEHLVRAELVAASRGRARARYGEFTEVIVVGDSRHDVEAALACGVTAIRGRLRAGRRRRATRRRRACRTRLARGRTGGPRPAHRGIRNVNRVAPGVSVP
jgi:phosphoglycolate phosphatase